jgi:hypothetical protein
MSPSPDGNDAPHQSLSVHGQIAQLYPTAAANIHQQFLIGGDAAKAHHPRRGHRPGLLSGHIQQAAQHGIFLHRLLRHPQLFPQGFVFSRQGAVAVFCLEPVSSG